MHLTAYKGQKLYIGLLILSLFVAVFATALLAPSVHANSEWEVVKYAGTPNTAGDADGPASDATFNLPSGLAISSDGSLYIADSNNNKIRKISPQGEVTTVAGNGDATSLNGKGTDASINGPQALTFDNSGNLYVTDFFGNLVRKITPDGVVTSLFDNLGLGVYAGGIQLDSPRGVAYRNGDIYVSDSNHHRIVKMTSSGEASIFVGDGTCGDADGTGIAGQLCNPAGLVFDQDGNLYIADATNGTIRKVNSEGVMTTFYDDGDLSVGINGQLGFDANGTLYVANSNESSIVAISPTGQSTRSTGLDGEGYLNGSADFAKFNNIAGIAISPDGAIFISDAENHVIREMLIPVYRVDIDSDEHEFAIGDTYTYKATVYSINAKNRNVTWTSSDPEVATIDNQGVMNVLKYGETTLTVITDDGGFTDSIDIQITQLPQTNDSLFLKGMINTLLILLSATFLIFIGLKVSKHKQWLSMFLVLAISVPSLIPVGLNRSTVSAIESTTTSVPVTDVRFVLPDPYQTINNVGGLFYSAPVTFAKEIRVYIGNSKMQLPVRIYPYNATDTSVTYTSSDTSIATVDAKGYVTALKEGDVTITATAKDGQKTAVMPVKARIFLNSISLDKTEYTVEIGKPIRVTPKMNPTNASFEGTNYYSYNSNIVTIDTSGNVTAVTPGNTKISYSVITNYDQPFNGGQKYIDATVFVPYPVTGVTVDKQSVALTPNNTSQLTATIAPSYTTLKSLLWTTSNSAVATVDSSGLVTAVGNGTAVIAATADSGDKSKKAMTTVTVTSPVEQIQLNKTLTYMNPNTTLQLIGTVVPATASIQTKTWLSSNPEIATVSNSGLVTGIAAGTTTITVTALDGNKTDVATVKVVRTTIINPTELEVDTVPILLTINSVKKFSATAFPIEATNRSVMWKSSKPLVASIDDNGNLKALSNGVTTITVSTQNGDLSKSFTVTVVTPVDSISINKYFTITTSTALPLKNAYTFAPQILPVTASNKSINWTSSNPGVATVDATGKVSAVSIGKTTITATTQDGNKVDTSLITVLTLPITSMTTFGLNKTSLPMFPQKTVSVYPIFEPYGVSNENVIWESSDSKVAIVNEQGQVTAIANGTATLTAWPKMDGDKKVSIPVTVTTPVNAISPGLLNFRAMKPTDTYQLSPIVYPTTATNKAVSYTIKDTKVASVDQNGLITAIASGNTEITMLAKDGSKEIGSFYVTVRVPIEKLTFESKYYRIAKYSRYSGGGGYLQVNVLPATATHHTLTVTSSDPTIIEASPGMGSDGSYYLNVNTLKLGKATITVSTEDGTILDTTVVEGYIPIDTVRIDGNSDILLSKGKTILLDTIVTPDDASEKTLAWSSDDTSVATVDTNGKVTAKSYGEVIIRVRNTTNSSTYSVRVTVKQLITRITYPNAQINMIKGETFIPQPIFAPSDASEKGLTWSVIEGTSIAQVSEGGKITALATGIAVVQAIATDGSYVKGNLTVNVTNPIREVTMGFNSLMIDKYDASTYKTVKLKFTPDLGDNYNDFKLTVANPTIVKIVDGKIIPLKLGKTTVSAVSTVYPNITASGEVTVVSELIRPLSFTLNGMVNGRILPWRVGDTFPLLPTFDPLVVTNRSIYYEYDKSMIQIADGYLGALKNGKSIVTAYSDDNNSKTFTFTVNAYTPVNELSIIPQGTVEKQGESIVLLPGKTLQLTTATNPTTANDQPVSWTSSVPYYATVDNLGKVTAKTSGTLTITASMTAGTDVVTKSITIIVPVSPTSASFASNSAIMKPNDTLQLNPTIVPANADRRTIAWRSDNRFVASVNENGLVTALGEGYATIYMKLPNGTEVKMGITVYLTIKKIILNEADFTKINSGPVIANRYNISPSNAYNQNVSVSSSDPTVATVVISNATTRELKITPLKIGKTTITVTSQDGNITAAMMFTVTPENMVYQTALKVDKTSIKLKLSETYQLKTILEPANATLKELKWISNDTTIATVDALGKITLVRNGKTTIWVGSQSQPELEALIDLEVYTPIEAIAINKTELNLEPTKTERLKVIYTPNDTTDQYIDWFSSDPSVASVDYTGKVTAGSKIGVTTITAKSRVKPTIKATTKVTVTILTTGISLDKTSITLDKNSLSTAKAKLTATVLPANAINKTVTWTSSNPAVATVNASGEVTAIDGGTATIQASTSDGTGKVASATVMVKFNVTGINLSDAFFYLTTNRENVSDTWKQLNVNILPANATNKKVTWTSSNTNVAAVDNIGKVTAVAPGSVTITVASEDGGFTASTSVTVLDVKINHVESITFDKTSDTRKTGQTFVLTPIFNPESSTVKTVTWTSSNPEVASVDASGTVTTLTQGTTTIRASNYNNKSATFELTVLTAVSNIVLDKSEVYIKQGSTLQAVATITPANAFEKTVTWAATQESVTRRVCTFSIFGVCFNYENQTTLYNRVTVDTNGLITATSVGTVNVTVTTTDGNKLATLIVHVIASNTNVIAPTGVTLNKSTDSIAAGGDTQLVATVAPNNATNKTVMWMSSDSKIATVDATGKVTGVKSGTVAITAKSNDGTYTATATITVN